MIFFGLQKITLNFFLIFLIEIIKWNIFGLQKTTLTKKNFLLEIIKNYFLLKKTTFF